MKKQKSTILFSLATVLLILAFFVILKDRHVIAEAPICTNITLKAGEKDICRVEAKNSSSSALNFTKIVVSIPDGAKIVSYDNDWSCTVSAEKMVCTKTQSPLLGAGKSDYLKITPQAIEAGTYDFSATMSGREGGTASPVVYTDKVDVAYTEVTAEAVDDEFYSFENSVFHGDVGPNDTLCSAGVTTFSFHDPVNGTVVSEGGSLFQFTASNTEGSFMYDILCNGTVVDSAQARLHIVTG